MVLWWCCGGVWKTGMVMKNDVVPYLYHQRTKRINKDAFSAFRPNKDNVTCTYIYRTLIRFRQTSNSLHTTTTSHVFRSYPPPTCLFLQWHPNLHRLLAKFLCPPPPRHLRKLERQPRRQRKTLHHRTVTARRRERKSERRHTPLIFIRVSSLTCDLG